MQVVSAYRSPQGLLNPGDLTSLPSALATQLIAQGVVVEFDAGSGTGVVVPTPYFRGIGEGETPAAFEAAGGAADTTPSAAVQGYLSEGTIIAGRLIPTALVGDKAQG